MKPESFIASLDVGTTTIRCQIFDSSTNIVGSARTNVKLIYPRPGFVEIDPNQLWEEVITIIKTAISDAKLTPKDIKCLGISTQRSTFSLWRRDSGVPFHNFITWKDMRAKELCKQLNSSFSLKAFRSLAYSLYCFTRNERFLTGSRLQVAPNHVTGRLLWSIQNIPAVKDALLEKNVMFGTVDTWLLYKFTQGRIFVTDISNASATGFFDPFVLEWSSWSRFFLGVPHEILPEVVANDYDFGLTDQSIFGASVPIGCVMGDQCSSMIASSCFATDDIKMTLGTGAFLNVNTGSKVHTSVTGIYPLIGWKIKDQIVCIGEVPCNDCGSLIQWILNAGNCWDIQDVMEMTTEILTTSFIKNPSEALQIATSVPDSDGVYFIPAFSGLGPPINDPGAGSGFLGVKPTTTQNHMVRSVLEGLAYRMTQAYETLKKERRREYKKVIVDGGVSQNDFICQLVADLTGICVERLCSSEMSALGVAFVSGIKIGVWEDKEQLKELNKTEQLFTPNSDLVYAQKCKTEFNKWLEAVERFKLWYKED